MENQEHQSQIISRPSLEKDLPEIQTKASLQKKEYLYKPSAPYIGASWSSMIIGIGAYLIGLWNASIESLTLSEKGYYFALLILGLFASVTLQKSVRDKLEGIKVTHIYYGITWAALASAILLFAIGLINASILLSEKGFYAMAYVLSLFAAITIQKNIRDTTNIEE